MKGTWMMKAALTCCATLIAASCCFALVMTKSRGDWPDTWPTELEALREQSRTVEMATGLQETIYEIPFTTRESFEAAWPFILRVKSDGAPLTLLSSPLGGVAIAGAEPMKAGVRILHPVPGGASSAPGTEEIRVGPPWPKEILDKNGCLPEYVTNDGGKWVACELGKGKGFTNRARVDIQLVVDGNIVDLNRIRLPGNSVIIDKRFPEKKNVR